MLRVISRANPSRRLVRGFKDLSDGTAPALSVTAEQARTRLRRKKSVRPTMTTRYEPLNRLGLGFRSRNRIFSHQLEIVSMTTCRTRSSSKSQRVELSDDVTALVFRYLLHVDSTSVVGTSSAHRKFRPRKVRGNTSMLVPSRSLS